LIRIPGFGNNGGKERGPSVSQGVIPSTLASDPQRRSVISYYVADRAPLDRVRRDLGERYTGMTSEHLDSVVTAIGKKREKRAANSRGL